MERVGEGKQLNAHVTANRYQLEIFLTFAFAPLLQVDAKYFYFQLTADGLEIGTDFAVSAVFLRMKSPGGDPNTPKRRKIYHEK